MLCVFSHQNRCTDNDERRRRRRLSVSKPQPKFLNLSVRDTHIHRQCTYKHTVRTYVLTVKINICYGSLSRRVCVPVFFFFVAWNLVREFCSLLTHRQQGSSRAHAKRLSNNKHTKCGPLSFRILFTFIYNSVFFRFCSSPHQ